MKRNTETTITKKEKQSIIQDEKSKADYKAQYLLQRTEMIGRQCVYVSKSSHERISRFLAVAGKNKITIGGYIDAIIEEHFRVNQGIINKIYQDEISNIL